MNQPEPDKPRPDRSPARRARELRRTWLRRHTTATEPNEDGGDDEHSGQGED